MKYVFKNDGTWEKVTAECLDLGTVVRDTENALLLVGATSDVPPTRHFIWLSNGVICASEVEIEVQVLMTSQDRMEIFDSFGDRLLVSIEDGKKAALISREGCCEVELLFTRQQALAIANFLLVGLEEVSD